MKLKAIFEYRSQNNDGHFIEDNPDSDYSNEIYIQSTWNTQLITKEFEHTEIKSIFDLEDGDEDSSNSLIYITDQDNKIVYNVHNLKNRKRAEEHIIEHYKYYQEEE